MDVRNSVPYPYPSKGTKLTPPPQQPYLDSPTSASPNSSTSSTTIKPLPALPPHTPYRDDPHTPPQRYTDDEHDDNIPLAHLLHSYPSEAPPSYSVAVRQSHEQYVPRTRSVVVEIDPETGEVVSRTDDVRHSMEKVAAMFVVAVVLLVLSGVFVWMAFGGR